MTHSCLTQQGGGLQLLALVGFQHIPEQTAISQASRPLPQRVDTALRDLPPRIRVVKIGTGTRTPWHKTTVAQMEQSTCHTLCVDSRDQLMYLYILCKHSLVNSTL